MDVLQLLRLAVNLAYGNKLEKLRASLTLYFCISNHSLSVLHCSSHQRRRFTLLAIITGIDY